jgi:hypothetical protein
MYTNEDAKMIIFFLLPEVKYGLRENDQWRGLF